MGGSPHGIKPTAAPPRGTVPHTGTKPAATATHGITARFESPDQLDVVMRAQTTSLIGRRDARQHPDGEGYLFLFGGKMHLVEKTADPHTIEGEFAVVRIDSVSIVEVIGSAYGSPSAIHVRTNTKNAEEAAQLAIEASHLARDHAALGQNGVFSIDTLRDTIARINSSYTITERNIGGEIVPHVALPKIYEPVRGPSYTGFAGGMAKVEPDYSTNAGRGSKITLTQKPGSHRWLRFDPVTITTTDDAWVLENGKHKVEIIGELYIKAIEQNPRQVKHRPWNSLRLDTDGVIALLKEDIAAPQRDIGMRFDRERIALDRAYSGSVPSHLPWGGQVTFNVTQMRNNKGWQVNIAIPSARGTVTQDVLYLSRWPHPDEMKKIIPNEITLLSRKIEIPEHNKPHTPPRLIELQEETIERTDPPGAKRSEAADLFKAAQITSDGKHLTLADLAGPSPVPDLLRTGTKFASLT